jgi:hypothetical protein
MIFCVIQLHELVGSDQYFIESAPFAGYLEDWGNTVQHKHRREQTFIMPWIGFKLMIPVFKQLTTADALHDTATENSINQN